MAKHWKRKKQVRKNRQSQYRTSMKDLVNRDFTSDTPGMKLVGDITFIPIGSSGKKFLKILLLVLIPAHG